VPVIIKGGFLYFNLDAVLQQLGGKWAGIDAAGTYAFLHWQRYFVFILMAIVGSRLIAKDKQENGLALYLARPLRLVDYVGGKMAILMFYYCLVTLLPVYALSLFAYLVSAGGTGLKFLLWIPLKTTLYCLMVGASMSLVMLALSALGRRQVFIAVGWALLFSGTEIMAKILTSFGQPGFGIIDYPAQYYQAGAKLFGTDPVRGFSPWLSLLLVVLYTVAAVTILRRRIRPVEVVP
jgi:hypothetical protein